MSRWRDSVLLSYFIIFSIIYATLVKTDDGQNLSDNHNYSHPHPHENNSSIAGEDEGERHYEGWGQNQTGSNPHYDEDDDDEEEREVDFLLRKERLPGDPHGPEHSLQYGENCVKSNPQACKYYPEVTCVWVENLAYVCRCDFLHTWNEEEKICVANVFSPCSQSGESSECGLNMECRPDKVGSNPNEKMCRCKKGFMVEMDEDSLPSKCVKDENFVEDDNQVIPAGQATPSVIIDHYFILVATLLLPILNSRIFERLL